MRSLYRVLRTKLDTSNPPYAHTPPGDDPDRWHLLEEHLRETARLAAEFAAPFQAGELARCLGQIHDLGKISPAFQDYLRRCHQARLRGQKGRVFPGGGDHKGAGALLAARLSGGERHNPMTFAVWGHHGGLPAKKEVANGEAFPWQPASDEAVSLAETRLSRLTNLPERLPLPATFGVTEWEQEMFVRMLFSCLADADSLDTERHFNPETAVGREATVSLEAWGERLRTDQARLQEKAAREADTDLARTVNLVRREVYEACLNAAERPGAVFRLTVPTGGGKTRASLAFALAHANCAAHPRQRVIYAIPFTSIVDQTARVFTEILGEAAPILVHHSAVPEEEGDAEKGGAVGDGLSEWRRLASQNWDAPLVVTTTVQLFESLFSNLPGKCRKLHNIAGSVIILDEAQTIPLPLLKPIVNALRVLVKHYQVTVVFCTATQPALEQPTEEENESFASVLGGFDEITDIVPQPARHFEKMVRVTYRVESEPWTWGQAAEQMPLSPSRQCLAVVNTRADALALLDALRDPNALHLSTLLCGAHRAHLLEEIGKRLRAGSPCLLVSTQVVEAGIDLDFPRVMRAVGPFDRIIQAAGRCNREGRIERGEVVIFFPAEGGMPPGPYRIAAEETARLLRRGNVNYDNPDMVRGYFRRLYQNVNLDAKGIQKLRKVLDYPEVAHRFRMIEQDTRPVLVPYRPQMALFEELEREAVAGRMTRAVWRRAQPLVVNLFKRDVQENLRAGTVDDLLPASPDTLYVWRGPYDDKTHRGLAAVASDPGDPD